MWLKLLAGKLERGTAKSAGYDIFASERVAIHPGGHLAIKTGVVTQFQEGHVALMRDKSGLALKHGITVLGGVIDADYDQEWNVILLNTGKVTVIFEPGMKLCNVLFCVLGEVRPADGHNSVAVGPDAVFTQKSDDRTGGFGSTGK